MQTLKPLSAITFLKTRDLNSTARFYSEILGFNLVLDQGSCQIFRIGTACHLGFCLSEGETGSSQVVLTLEIQDVDDAYLYLKSCGVEVEIPPRLNEKYKIYQMFFRDPNGYLIEVQRFLDPQWELNRQLD